MSYSAILGLLIIILAAVYASCSKKVGDLSTQETLFLIKCGIGFVLFAFAVSAIRIWLFPFGYTFSEIVLLRRVPMGASMVPVSYALLLGSLIVYLRRKR